MSEGYNGWTNYETWNCKLWLDNDEGSYSYWTERAQEAYDEAEADDTFTRTERATLDLARMLESEHEDNAPELGASFYSDILNAGISAVNWHEIAASMMEDVDKTEDEDEDEDARDARIAELTALIAAEEISEENGARAQRDDAGNVVVDLATCGTCGRTWNDALISGRTPAPSARCPYEGIHAEIAELEALKARAE